MSKLETFKNNLLRQKRERVEADKNRAWLAAGDGPAHVIQRLTSPEGHHPIMDPPQDLINLYCMEAEVYARENMIGDSTLTREQMSCMLQDHLMKRHRTHIAADSLGMVNRRSYWKPSVRVRGGTTIQISLGDKLIGSLS